jgi:putative ABC transport system permease protein
LVPSIRDAILAVDKSQPITGMQTMTAVVNRSFSSQWSHMLLLSIFGLIALILAAIGCYALVAYSVAQRTHEIGLRLALGAQPSGVLGMLVREAGLIAGVGILIGVAGALALTRFLRSLLFQIQPTDPATFVGVGILLTLVALLACYIPARRAMKVDPLVALRYE